MKKAAVIGNPIEHSRSPLIHNYWLTKHNIEGSYEAIKAEDERDFENVVDRLIEEGYSGFNVTTPFKEKAYDLIDKDLLTAFNTHETIFNIPDLKTANTLFIQDNKISGFNTDFYGFYHYFYDECQDLFESTSTNEFGGFETRSWFKKPDINNVVILGAGGSARIIAYGLLNDYHAGEFFKGKNCVLTILNRDINKAEILSYNLEDCNINTRLSIEYNSINNFEEAIRNCDLLINCTTIGMQGGAETPNFSFQKAKSSMIFYDLVYTPLITPLSAKAAKMGLKTISGLGMLVYQAMPGFQVFFREGKDNPMTSLRAFLSLALPLTPHPGTTENDSVYWDGEYHRGIRGIKDMYDEELMKKLMKDISEKE